MLQFDFRNGPLRRKYDGLKYALKTIEDVCYEMSLVDDRFSSILDSTTNSIEMPTKKLKLDPDSDANTVEQETTEMSQEVLSTSDNAMQLIDIEAIDRIRQRLDKYDKLREETIKQSRDVQKLAKQAIFAVHRGSIKDARVKLDQSLIIINRIFKEIVNEVNTDYYFEY